MTKATSNSVVFLMNLNFPNRKSFYEEIQKGVAHRLSSNMLSGQHGPVQPHRLPMPMSGSDGNEH